MAELKVEIPDELEIGSKELGKEEINSLVAKALKERMSEKLMFKGADELLKNSEEITRRVESYRHGEGRKIREEVVRDVASLALMCSELDSIDGGLQGIRFEGVSYHGDSPDWGWSEPEKVDKYHSLCDETERLTKKIDEALKDKKRRDLFKRVPVDGHVIGFPAEVDTGIYLENIPKVIKGAEDRIKGTGDYLRGVECEARAKLRR